MRFFSQLERDNEVLDAELNMAPPFSRPRVTKMAGNIILQVGGILISAFFVAGERSFGCMPVGA